MMKKKHTVYIYKKKLKANQRQVEKTVASEVLFLANVVTRMILPQKSITEMQSILSLFS